ncbi:MAG TPA: phosphomannomutase/phosphoglucomutase [Candidatus Krumholzibacteria bacterium]|nr:phosphomannomutase/phosphoglucomutase [Candidatus Krumholzibacteria bacterium]
MPSLKKTMFREYDIRGRVNDEELNARSAEWIGRGFGTYLARRGIDDMVVGYDSRFGSVEIKDGLVKGLRATGRNVVMIGMCLTPMMYWSQYRFKVKGGAMITGSHNPKGWNGLKLGAGFSSTLVASEIQELYGIIEREDFATGHGDYAEAAIFDDYAADLTGRVKIARPLKIVIDTGNGTAGAFAPRIFRDAGLTVVEQFTDLDPEFPNHEPDPARTDTVEALGKRVRAEKADLGMAFDGDGDRFGVVDENGDVIWPDRYMILLARQVLERVPGGKIVFDVKCTQALEDDIRAHGGIPIMWKTGHSHIKAKLHDEQAALAGEMSGHVFFVENYYGFDDGVYSGLRFVEYVSGRNEPLSRIMAGTPAYLSTPAINVKCADEVKYGVVERLTAELKRDFDRVVDINGARVVFPDGWGLVRASSNLPELVLRFEARTPERLQEIKQTFRGYLDRYPEVDRHWENE